MQENGSVIPSGADTISLLSDSWSRSQLFGLERTADDFPRLSQGELLDLIVSNVRLQQLSQPVMNKLARQMTDKQAVVILSDSAGWVHHTFGNIHAMEKAQRSALSPGNLWSECSRGTNAIGTALAINDGCEITGSQHFLSSNRHLYCAAMPLLSPDGHIAGVLDISGPVQFSHTHTLAWVQTAVKQIEYLWVRQSLHPRQWLMSLHQQPEKLDSIEEGLLVFSDDVLIAVNRQALQILGLCSEQVGVITFSQLFPQQAQVPCSVPMPIITAQQSCCYFRLRAPERRTVSVGPATGPMFPFSASNDGEKMVRLLNAGVSLCIHGETGCGKEFISQVLYRHSRWREGKFVAINCAAIPESLIESELFGYQPGAFTGASKNGYTGRIREAEGGVLFLDEIGDMPLPLQTRLLRVLQDKEVAPLGTNRSWPVNFAVICATHHNLARLVADGEFREDLFYRLQEFSLTVPPLRDWPALPAFIRQQWCEMGGEERNISLSSVLVGMLAQHSWPGNVRQLRSVLKVLLALADDDMELQPDMLPMEYQRAESEPTDKSDKLQIHGERLFTETLARFNGNISKAARELGVARSTLYRRGARAGKEGA